MTVTSFNVPGEPPGSMAMTVLMPSTETKLAGEPPIMTLAPDSKPVPTMLVGMPPVESPDDGLMLVTSRDAVPG